MSLLHWRRTERYDDANGSDAAAASEHVVGVQAGVTVEEKR